MQYQLNKMQSNIDYRVKDASKFFGKRGQNNKQIAKIVEKKGEFQFSNSQDQFQIEVIFKNNAVINKIELQVKNVNQISIDMFREDVKVESFHKTMEKERIKVFTRYDFKLEQKAQIFDRAQIRFLNFPEPMVTCIKYIFFKGFKEEGSKRKTMPTNLSQNDTFQHYSKKKTAEQKQEQKKVFQSRQKTKQKTPVHQLVSQLPKNVHRGGKYDEQEQIKKAIQLSKKQHQKQKQNKIQIQSKHYDFEEDKPEENGFFEYSVVEWQKVKKVYEHVSAAWVEAQRKIEKQRNIQPRHSVAEKIKQKVFQKLTFSINIIKADQKTKLMHVIKQLGGKIIDEPQNNCYIITNTMQGGKINLSKTLSHIIYVKPDFVHQCSQLGTLLDYHHYKP